MLRKQFSSVKIYTRQGDSGTTSLGGGIRVNKDDPRIEVCGCIDELSATLGLVRCEKLSPETDVLILRIQHELIEFCAEIVSDTAKIFPEHIRQLEAEIDRLESKLPPLTQFIIPGKNRISAALHLARTVCRRAERTLFTLRQSQTMSLHLAEYLNRLSDWLFILARTSETAS